MLKRNHRAAFGGGATHNSLIAKVCKGLKNKFNRLFDEESNSNILHGYKLYVITRNNDEQIGHGFIQRDVVIRDKEYNNEMLKQVQHDSLLCCHAEGALATEESHNLKSPSVIPSTSHQCHPELVSGSQKLRRFRNLSWIIGRSAGSTQPSLGRVPLSLHSCQNPQFGMTVNNSTSAKDYNVAPYNKLCTEKSNSPRNDSEVCSLAPCGRGLGGGGKCYDVVQPQYGNIASKEKENNMKTPIDFEKDNKNVKNLLLLKKKAAFTLTEVLLAVLIVGIIAAMVLPAIVTKYQDKAFESAFNREVHSLQDSIDSLAAVENQPSFYETTLATNTGTYMKKYLRVSKYCETSGKDCFGKFYSEYSGHEKKTYTPSYDGSCAILKNGTSVCLSVNGGNVNMLIDVNGPKGPNVLGRDLRTYTHSVRSKTGYDMSPSGIIALNQPPIKENSTDEDPTPTPTPDPDPTPTPTPDPTPKCTTSDTSLACCKERGITKGQSDPCCKYSYFDSNSTCHPTQMLTVEFNSYIAGYNTPQISVTCSSSASSTTVDLSQVKGNVTAVWSSSNMGNYSKTYSFWGCSSNRKVLNTQDSIPEAATGFSSATIQYKGYNITSSNTCSKSMPRCVVYFQWRE